jgi:hypothetical protein
MMFIEAGKSKGKNDRGKVRSSWLEGTTR